MKKLLPLTVATAALLAPASTAQADPTEPVYGHCVKAVALIGSFSPSAFNEVSNPVKSQGNKPGAPQACLFTIHP